MQKTLKVLAALGIMSCVAFVVGQARDKGVFSPGSQGGGAQIASKEEAGRFAPANGAQRALREYIMAIDNRNVALANEKNRPDIAQACVDVQCYYILATMKPDERKHEVDTVWQVDKYRPNGQWNHITSAPILVDELLRIDAKRSAAIQKILDEDRDEWMKPFMEQSARVAKRFPGKKWATMSQAEKDLYVKLSNEELVRYRKGRTSGDILTEHVVFFMGTVKKVKALLTKSEIAEFDRFVAAFDKDQNAAFAGNLDVLKNRGGR